MSVKPMESKKTHPPKVADYCWESYSIGKGSPPLTSPGWARLDTLNASGTHGREKTIDIRF